MASLREKLVDKRTVERNIDKGLITKEEYDRHLVELGDLEGTYDRVEIDPGDAGEQPRE